MAGSEAHRNAQTIRRLYAGIKAHNVDEIAACYAADAYFEDIAFKLRGKPRVMQMWQMICTKTKPEVTTERDLSTEPLPPPTADDETGQGCWRAKYFFGKTETDKGRPVDNTLTSKFRFRGGLIVDHRDDCNVLAWAWQALPFPKSLLAAAVPKKRRAMAQEKLDAFVASLPPAEATRFASAPAGASAPAAPI
jgi:ketosteroid isomerase-like protein